MTDISWNLQALANDASAWKCVADRLGEAHELMADAAVSYRDFMAFLPSSGAASSATAAAVDALREFAAGGEVATRHGADVLIEVRDAYRDNEENARATLSGLWEPDSD